MRLSDLEKLNEARRARQAAALITDLGTGESQVQLEGETAKPDLREAIDKAYRSGKSGILEPGDGRRLFLNVQVPPPRIVVIGAVHISQALAEMARVAGFDIRIIDPRTAFATEERFRGIDLVADWPEDVLTAQPLDAYTLGSRKTHAKRVERLLAEGLTAEDIARIDAPIGLDIGAQSPAEIAVAVLGAIIQAFRKREIRS
jgi:xanthine dehydrogenase accessory factor